MTILPISSRVALAAVAASLLTSAHHAEAKGGNGHMALGAMTTGMNKPGSSPVTSRPANHRGAVSTPKRAGIPSGAGLPIIRDHRGEMRTRTPKPICAGWAC